MQPHISIAILLGLALCGCTNMGPTSVPRDRFAYNLAVADSWKEQTLLNIVKLRYADVPLFVDVASIVSGYTLERSVNINGTVSSPDTVQGDFLSAGATGRFIDRPTITYAPIMGAKFNETFMTPIDPSAVLFLMQSGWPSDIVLPMTVDSINGYRSAVVAGSAQREGDATFYKVMDAIREIQRAGVVGMRIHQDQRERNTTVMFFHREQMTSEEQGAVARLEELLGLSGEGEDITVSYGLFPETEREIAIITRSMLQIMLRLAAYIDVPEQHVTEGRTLPAGRREGTEHAKLSERFRIHSALEEPGNSFVSVKYKDHWYWIDEGDYRTKHSFTFLMILMSQTETGSNKGLPLVTIPAG